MQKIDVILKELGKDAIFKFRPFDIYSLEILTNKKLYFGDPNFQNDPVENNYKLDISNLPKKFGPFTRKYLSTKQNRENVLSWVKLSISNKLYEKIGICCFSKKYDEYLLWSHYANGAKGICLIFDKKELIDSLKNENETVVSKDVNYNGLPVIMPLPNKKGNSIEFNMEDIIFNKQENWKYEDEVRIMCITKKKDEFEYNEKKRLLKFSESSLKGIILGERFEKYHIETLKNVLENSYSNEIPLLFTQRNRSNPEILEYY